MFRSCLHDIDYAQGDAHDISRWMLYSYELSSGSRHADSRKRLNEDKPYDITRVRQALAIDVDASMSGTLDLEVVGLYEGTCRCWKSSTGQTTS
jgi:hypothetical protein